MRLYVNTKEIPILKKALAEYTPENMEEEFKRTDLLLRVLKCEQEQKPTCITITIE